MIRFLRPCWNMTQYDNLIQVPYISAYIPKTIFDYLINHQYFRDPDLPTQLDPATISTTRFRASEIYTTCLKP